MASFSNRSCLTSAYVANAITEVVQALVLCGRPFSHIPVHSEHSIKVKMFSTKDGFRNGHQHFKVNILSDRGLDFAQALEDDWFRSLVKVTEEELCDGALFVTRQVGEEDWVQDQYDLNTTPCILQNCENICGKKMPPFKIQFQVLDFQENIVKTYQKLQFSFRTIKLFQPMLQLMLNLRIFGLECKNELSSDLEYLQEDITRSPVIISPGYFSRTADILCSLIHVKTGEMIPLPKPADCDFQHPLSIRAVALLLPFSSPRCTENHGFINILFGFDSQPFSLVKILDEDLMFDSYQPCLCDNCVNPDPFDCPIQILVKHLSSIADRLNVQKSFVIYIYLSIHSEMCPVQPNKPAAQFSLFQTIQIGFPQWYPVWKQRIQLAINSALCSIWYKDYVCVPSEVQETQQIVEQDSNEETQSVHSDPVPLATDSLASFLSATTNDDFKRSCLQALQVKTVRAAKKVLSRELSRFTLHHPNEHSDTQGDEDCYSQSLDETFEDLDNWTEEE